MNPFDHHKQEAEKVHRAFLDAHWKILAARDHLTTAIRVAQRVAENLDNRKSAEEWEMKFKIVRTGLESIMREASRMSADLIGLTGCDGSCKK